MDSVAIHDLEVFGRVGVPDWERAVPQRLLLTLVLGLDFTAAAAGDDLRHTIDYAAVSRTVRKWIAEGEWRLIETIGVKIAEGVLAEFGPASIVVEVKKFILPEARLVSVRVERSRAR